MFRVIAKIAQQKSIVSLRVLVRFVAQTLLLGAGDNVSRVIATV
jgi:hypothetical protein